MILISLIKMSSKTLLMFDWFSEISTLRGRHWWRVGGNLPRPSATPPRTRVETRPPCHRPTLASTGPDTPTPPRKQSRAITWEENSPRHSAQIVISRHILTFAPYLKRVSAGWFKTKKTRLFCLSVYSPDLTYIKNI